MLKLLKYLKGSVHIILIIILLLMVQAWGELELPSYTSGIVTRGIQQKGVDSPVPDRMREETMEDLCLFLDKETETLVREAYTSDGNGVLTLNRMSGKEKEDLAGRLAGAEIVLLMLTADDIRGTMEAYLGADAAGDGGAASETAETGADAGAGAPGTAETGADAGAAAPGTAETGVNAGAGAGAPAGISMLPGIESGEDALEAMRKLPALLRAPILNQISGAMEKIPETTREQIAISFVQNEYEALGEDLAKTQTRYLLVTGGKMLFITVLVVAASILVSFFASRLAARTARTLRGDVYRKVIHFNSEEFHRFSTASLITRSTNDIQQVQMFLAMGLRMLFFAPIMAVGGIIKVTQTNVSLSWIIVLAVVLLFLLIFVLFRVSMPKFTILQSLIDRLNLVSREQLTGIMVTRAFSAEEQEEERFDTANTDLMKTNLFVNRAMVFMMPAMMLIMNGVSVLIIYAGAHGIDRGMMQVGDMMAFIQYSMQIIMAFLFISMMSIFIPRANVAANRISEVLETEVRIQDIPDPKKPAEGIRGQIEFDHVTFAYPDAGEPVLQDISFTAGQGQTVAFIGSTGSGKSTLVDLIPRFYDVTEGSIKVDGVDIREMDRADLRGRIGFVPQKSILFTGTIRTNICYGADGADEENMKHAARIAQAESFIEEKEYGYDSGIAQGGTNVSGGQRQRLAIARAIAIKPEILIFDDSFSALDFRTDAALRSALKEETGDTTVLIVAQRISSIMQADHIVVLDEGRIAGAGTHAWLMKNCEVYRQIATSQLSEEELAG